MSTAAIVLAAGSSTRLGRPKQLEPWGATTLLGHVIEATRAFEVDEIWVVLGSHLEEVLEQVDLEDCGIVENPEWEEGIASSIRVGLDALLQLSRVESALIVIGDQPEIQPEVVAELLERHQASGLPVTVPKYRYTWGNPIVVDRSLWPRLMSLEGDSGAQRLFLAHPEWVEEVWFGSSPPRDVDTKLDVRDMKPRTLGSPADPGVGNG